MLDAPRTITGVVTDKLTGKPIVGAKVRVEGTVLIFFQIPIVADWKGRQGHVGNMYALQSNSSMIEGPAAFTTTNSEGRYRISAFGNRYGQRDFAITVSSPDGTSYLSSKKTITWPRKATCEIRRGEFGRNTGTVFVACSFRKGDGTHEPDVR